MVGITGAESAQVSDFNSCTKSLLCWRMKSTHAFLSLTPLTFGTTKRYVKTCQGLAKESDQYIELYEGTYQPKSD